MDKIDFMEWALGISNPDIFPYRNYAMLMILINLGWIVVRRKYKINYLPTFFVVLMLGMIGNMALYFLGMLVHQNDDIFIETVDPRLVRINRELSSVLGIKFVYIALSPFLVMGEAFAAGHISFMFTTNEVLRFFGPKFFMATLNATGLCYGLPLIFGQDAPYLPSWESAWEITVFLSFNVLSEGAAPLERNPSKKMQMEHIK